MNFKRNINIIRNVRNSLYILGVCLILIGLNDIFPRKPEVVSISPSPTAYPTQMQTVLVTRVIDGNDVMKTLNLKPGPKIGEILNDLFEKVVNKKIENKKEDLLAALTPKT